MERPYKGLLVAITLDGGLKDGIAVLLVLVGDVVNGASIVAVMCPVFILFATIFNRRLNVFDYFRAECLQRSQSYK